MRRRRRVDAFGEVDPRAGASWMRFAAVSALVSCIVSTRALAQAEVQGRVLAGDRRPIASAEVAVPRLSLRAVSDSLGRYRLQHLPKGEHLIVTNASGFRPDSALTALDPGETLVVDVVLESSPPSLEQVHVVAKSAPVMRGRMAGFEDRKAAGVGHFFDRAAFDSARNGHLSDILAGKVPGVAIYRGAGDRAWAATGRGNTIAACALCKVVKSDILDRTDASSGAPLVCYMDIYLDGAVVYSAGNGKQTPLFNLNRLDPRQVEGIEVYASAAQVPSQFVRTGGGCGVMLIWTRGGR